jgi:uncharacterized protein YqiB (DUF1249 family)
MQAPPPFLKQFDLLVARPTVGDLMSLCEENYRSLVRLAPRLSDLRGTYLSCDEGGADLLLEVREQAPYTTIFRLTHLFSGVQQADTWHAEPDATLKAYHDARQVEVLDLRQTVLPLFSHYRSPALRAKWKANLFVSKWLTYCVYRGHRFPPVPSPHRADHPRELTPAS